MNFFRRKAQPEPKREPKKLKLNKGVIPNKYREYWFTEDGSVYTEAPTDEEGNEVDAFYCVAHDLKSAEQLYTNYLYDNELGK